MLGDNMKRFLLTILLALIIGICLGVYSYNKFMEEDVSVVSNINEVYAFQVGVFDNFDNANTLAKKYGGVVILDENKYRVYLAIVSKALNLVKKYFDDKNIAYYLKTIYVGNEFKEHLDKEEDKIINSDISNYPLILKSILKEYETIES